MSSDPIEDPDARLAVERSKAAVTPSYASSAPYTLRVMRFFPTVRDFDRAEDGTMLLRSREGPERLEAKAQIMRERLIAANEVMILQERLRWCFLQEGVNHIEHCKSITEEIYRRRHSPSWGAPKPPYPGQVPLGQNPPLPKAVNPAYADPSAYTD